MRARDLARTLVNRLLNPIGYTVVRWKTAPENEWLQALGIRTVLDVGAYIGHWSWNIHRILPHARILAFEPLGESFGQLQQNLSDISGAVALQCAIGERCEDAVMHHNEYALSSSLLTMGDLHKEEFPFTANSRPEDVRVLTLDAAVREALSGAMPEPPVLLKIDVQGFEDRVILGASETLKSARLVIVETSLHPLYQEQASFEDVHRLMLASGFSYWGNFDQFRSPKDGRILQVDAIYGRD